MTTGRLVLVGTPIGNLGDMSPRAVEALAAADVVCCEDTRRTGRLLRHVGVTAPKLVVLNEHTEASVAAGMAERLGRGESVAVVSDAGTPGISDPGERVVAAALDAGFLVEVVPGPVAGIVALVASGLPTGRFVFEGFLPRKGSGRTRRLAEVAAERRTVVLYEAPHRLIRTLADLVEVCGPQRRVSVGRELTKFHEQHLHGSLASVAEEIGGTEPRGEYVVVLEGAPEPEAPDDAAILAGLAAATSGGLSTRDAVAAVSERLGVARRRVYELATGR